MRLTSGRFDGLLDAAKKEIDRRIGALSLRSC